MKRIFDKIKYIGAFALSSLVLFSCVEDGIDISGEGTSRIRLNSTAGTWPALFDDFTAEGATLISVWRDAVSPSDLDKSVTVEVEVDDPIIVDYNAAELLKDSLYVGFEILPTEFYTLVAESLTFAKGEFNKPLQVNLTATSVDLTIAYAVGIRLKNPTGGYEFASGKSEAVVQIVFKNKYDGVYSASGTMVDDANATLTGFYPLTWELVTTGAQQVTVIDNVYIGAPGHIINTPTGLSYYGNYGLVVNFIQETGAIASVVNYYGQPAPNSRSAELDPSGVNAFNPDDRSITIKYFMKQPTVIVAAPNIRVRFDEVWKYSGSR